MALIADIIDGLDDYGFADSSESEKVRAIQGAIREIERKRPWPFLETSALLNFDGTNAVASDDPGDMRSILRVYDVLANRRLMPVRLDDADGAIGAQPTLVGDPRFYYIEGGQLKFWPIPPAGTDRIRVRYLRRSANITSASADSEILIPVEHGEVILFMALTRLFDKEDDPELAVRFEQLAEKALQDLVDELFHQQYDEPDVVHVLDPDDYDS